jgi:hypothetical protein
MKQQSERADDYLSGSYPVDNGQPFDTEDSDPSKQEN